MTTQRELTTRFVASVGPAPAGKRVEIKDTLVKAFTLRVTDKGAKSYIMDLRWPASMCIKRRIGNADIMPLAEARDIAREWLRLVEKGIDPEQVKQHRVAEEARARATPFEARRRGLHRGVARHQEARREGRAGDPARAGLPLARAPRDPDHPRRRDGNGGGDQGPGQVRDGAPRLVACEADMAVGHTPAKHALRHNDEPNARGLAEDCHRQEGPARSRALRRRAGGSVAHTRPDG